MSSMIEVQVEFSRGFTQEEEAGIMETVKDIWPLEDILNVEPYHIAGTGNLTTFSKGMEGLIRELSEAVWDYLPDEPLKFKVVYLEEPPYDEWTVNNREDLANL